VNGYKNCFAIPLPVLKYLADYFLQKENKEEQPIENN
jgi:hypothetical protein